MSVDFTAAAARDELTRDEADSPMFAAQPVYARPAKRRSNSAFGAIPPVALVGIPVALVAIGAAAYLVLAPSDNSTAALTPGSPAPVAMAPAIPPAPMTPP
ncbi:MAG: hypothetical protein Q8M88_09900, partial [Phenylobacterium sp.]|nr:hypothetical protein [Phenylobacterium sp.]